MFCLFGLSPIGSLLAAALHETRDETVTITVMREMVGPTGNREAIVSMERQLSKLVSWNRSRSDSQLDMMAFSMVEERAGIVHVVVVDSKIGSSPGKDIVVKGGGLEKGYGLVELLSILSSLDHWLLAKVEWDLAYVLGVSASTIVMDNIDTMLTQSSLTEALAMVFSRPGLD